MVPNLEGFTHNIIGKNIKQPQGLPLHNNGDITNVHDMMVAVEKANKSFKMMMEIRNNVIEAYREMMGARV